MVAGKDLSFWNWFSRLEGRGESGRWAVLRAAICSRVQMSVASAMMASTSESSTEEEEEKGEEAMGVEKGEDDDL